MRAGYARVRRPLRFAMRIRTKSRVEMTAKYVKRGKSSDTSRGVIVFLCLIYCFHRKETVLSSAFFHHSDPLYESHGNQIISSLRRNFKYIDRLVNCASLLWLNVVIINARADITMYFLLGSVKFKC